MLGLIVRWRGGIGGLVRNAVFSRISSARCSSKADRGGNIRVLNSALSSDAENPISQSRGSRYWSLGGRGKSAKRRRML